MSSLADISVEEVSVLKTHFSRFPQVSLEESQLLSQTRTADDNMCSLVYICMCECEYTVLLVDWVKVQAAGLQEILLLFVSNTLLFLTTFSA
jgi:hypothetical protein